MEFIIIITLLLLNGVFAMYEMALVSSSKTRLETMAGRGSKSAKAVLRQLESPEEFLSAIQIGITLIGIVSGAFGGVAIAHQITPFVEKIPALAPYADKISMTLVVAIITYLSLIIGELVPKSIALSNPEKYSTLLNPAMTFMSKIAYPFVWLLSMSTRLLNKLIGISGEEERLMTQEELKMILHQSSEQGVIDKDETEMLRDVFRFSNKRAYQLMTYRKDLIVFHSKDSKQEILNIIKQNQFSNYLLINQHKDEVIGVISVKDLILMIGSDEEFDLNKIAQQPLFIPESLYAKKVLELFKTNKNKFGIVVNEYGGIEGIITLHDLTESVFGDILEENEEKEENIILRKDGSMLVEASMSIIDFMDEMNIMNYEDLENEDFTTLGGMAMFFIGSIPKTGDIFSYKNLEFEIVDMDGERVDKLLVTVKE